MNEIHIKCAPKNASKKDNRDLNLYNVPFNDTVSTVTLIQSEMHNVINNNSNTCSSKYKKYPSFENKCIITN